MKQRARVLLRPDSSEPIGVSRPADALAVWLAGGLWLVVCVLVARLDLGELLPAAIGGGVVLALGGRRLLSLAWVPVAAALALLVNPLMIVTGGPSGRLLTHLDLVLLAVITLTVARTAAGGAARVGDLLRRPLLHVLAAVGVVALAVIATSPHPVFHVRAVARAITGFVLGLTIFHRPQRTARLWSGVAVITAAIVLATVLSLAIAGLAGLRTFAAAADLAWRAPRAMMHTLLFAAPVTFGFAVARRRAVERYGLMALAIAALVCAEILSLIGVSGAHAPRAAAPLALGAWALLAAALAAAVVLGVARARERWIWLGLAAGYATLLGGATPAVLAASPVLLLGSVAAGAMAGALERDEPRGLMEVAAGVVADEATVMPAVPEAVLEEVA